jgi:hypothetical protein
LTLLSEKGHIHPVWGDPVVKLLSKPSLEMESGHGNQNGEPGQIREKTRSQKNNAGQENQQSIQKVFSRHFSVHKAFSDFEHGLQTLKAGEKGPQKTGQNHDDERVEGPYIGTDFDKEIDFEKWDDRECQKEF